METFTSSSSDTSSTISVGIPHHRHPITLRATNNEVDDLSEQSPLIGGGSAAMRKHWLLPLRHLSMMGDEQNDETSSVFSKNTTTTTTTATIRQGRRLVMGTLLILVFLLAAFSLYRGAATGGTETTSDGVGIRFHHSTIVPVEEANEHWLDLGNGLQLWFRTWGRMDGIPIVFIHGGPGNAIADYYDNGNKRFFEDANHTYFVVEIDQRGTGNSQPSVREDWRNMKYYMDISMDKMCADFEQVRTHLGIDEWLVWGGSYGSTLAINYGERYPESCMALILRGIYLDTPEEAHAVYSRDVYLDHPKRLREFDILYNYAARYVKHQEEEEEAGVDVDKHHLLDPNDAERLLRVYAEMIENGDHHASWHWFVFENNLMETDPQYILDPDEINNTYYRESLSVAFFETHLWLHGSFDVPSDLLNPSKIDKLTMPMWICQGQHDEVCPPRYARRLVDAVEAADKSPKVVSRFVNATHEDTDPKIEECLKWSLREFSETLRHSIL